MRDRIERFERRSALRKTATHDTKESVAPVDDEPPLNGERLTPDDREMILSGFRYARFQLLISTRWWLIGWSVFVLMLGCVGLLLLSFALEFTGSASASDVTQTVHPTLPLTATNTPIMTPTPTPQPTPTRTRFPTATPTSENKVKAQLITQEYPYGWYNEMAGETEYNKNLCTHEINLEFCDYGFSTVNLSPYTGPDLEPYPRRFVVFLMWHGYARWWSGELEDGKGKPFLIGQGLPFTNAELEQGICVPVLWNIEASPTLKRLNGRIGSWARQVFLGKAGLSELPEDVSGIPTALQLEIFDKPPEGCNTITEGFPSEYLPEYLKVEQ